MNNVADTNVNTTDVSPVVNEPILVPEVLETKVYRADALALYTTEKGLDGIIEQIKKEVAASNVFDISTAKGRKEIASLANKVARSKTVLDKIGKELVAELKKKPKLIDAERKRMRDYLDKLKAEVRAPLTEWEQKEEQRKLAHEAFINQFSIFTDEPYQTSDELKQAISKVDALGEQIGENLEEYQERAMETFKSTKADLAIKLASMLEAEEIARKLEAERAAKEAAERAAREEQIRKEAAEKAKKEAEIAAKERELALERARLEAEEAERKIREDAERAKREYEAAAKEAERKIKEAAEKARKESEAAALKAKREAEERIKQEQEAQERAEKARIADKEHRRQINLEILEALVKLGMDQEMAKLVIVSTVNKQIPRLTINY